MGRSGVVASPFDVHPGVATVLKWVAELKPKTGRSLEEWIEVIRRDGPTDEKRRRDWLKSTHKLGSNAAWWLAERSEGKGGEDDADAYLLLAARHVDDQYAGPKEALRPMFDVLLQLGKSLGDDVKACPCKTIVPFYRNHVFAQIKPSTNRRIDLGLSLTHYKGKLPKRLIDTGGAEKKDRITHRIEIGSSTDIDREVEHWLKTAYDLDG